MIRDVDELPDGAVLRSVVGVVGGGLAGLEVARYLGRHGVRVVLLESGRLTFDAKIQELAHVESVGKPLRTPSPEWTPYLPLHYRGEARIRQFGGTSNAWTGKWRTFDPFDFEMRPWVPYSGWPIAYDELRPHYEEIKAEYELGDFGAFERSEGVRRLRALARPAGLELSFHVWQGTTFRPATKYLDELRQSGSVDVVLGATATELLLADDLRRVRAVVFRSLDGRTFELEAERFVLAMGGLDGARLLLASNRQVPAGIGNERDLVGRFHMDHPKHKRGVLRHARVLRKPHYVGTATQPRPRFHTTFALSHEIQRERRLLNHLMRLTPVYRHAIEYPVDKIVSVKRAVRSASPRRIAPAALSLLTDPAALRKIAERRIWANHGGSVSHYVATMYVEQAPNRESRLYLSPERDVLGMPKLVVDWRLSDLDHDSFARTVDGLERAFAMAGFGDLDLGVRGLEDTGDGAHPMGATRMAARPEDGVVDRDCRVFGTENLFIASSSVFPTGHSASPTFTIVALARRLGAHLVGRRVGDGASAPRSPRSALPGR